MQFLGNPGSPRKIDSRISLTYFLRYHAQMSTDSLNSEIIDFFCETGWNFGFNASGDSLEQKDFDFMRNIPITFDYELDVHGQAIFHFMIEDLRVKLSRKQFAQLTELFIDIAEKTHDQMIINLFIARAKQMISYGHAVYINVLIRCFFIDSIGYSFKGDKIDFTGGQSIKFEWDGGAPHPEVIPHPTQEGVCISTPNMIYVIIGEHKIKMSVYDFTKLMDLFTSIAEKTSDPKIRDLFIDRVRGNLVSP